LRPAIERQKIFPQNCRIEIRLADRWIGFLRLFEQSCLTPRGLLKSVAWLYGCKRFAAAARIEDSLEEAPHGT
jgi:hypothetical protein